ncbi:MAG: 30S ribosomal protein S14 [Gemmatimonadetes bacterium]|nr:30S ribosomal protein S14 [Gemmatimonadota bacterium]MXX71751.1 30S ribosomal protein S14 [Gemmatimonadota bacterium]MYC92840.1 30S ribosomal protein S14 [Gemmatimonadota bacterium]MYG35365.1 30S ribosomal protein S14 [Gemmatimonadota bacterium]MYJ17073.1 30S ribosomal protein S14 [Gemmatimonadota bacterium]
MAKKGKLEKNERRAKLVAKYAEKRRELTTIMKNADATPAEKAHAMAQLQALPRDSAAVRYRNRCQMTGRPRGFIGKFGLSRIALREMSLHGLIPGVRKSSW